MKRFVVFLAIIGLLVGSITTVEAAKKKKKKKPPVVTLAPTELKFFIHWDDDGAGGCAGAQYMDLEDKAGDTGCSFVFQPAQEVFMAAGEDPLSYVWPATAGVPFTLDASRKIVIEWAMRATVAVNTKVEVTIEGTTGGEMKEIAAGESPVFHGGATGQTGPILVKLELDPDKALDKLTFDSLTMTTTFRGVCACYEGREGPGSFVVIPAFN
jgi:hypothetical protein